MAKINAAFLGDIFEQETPTGLVNGSNTSYSLSGTPHSDKSVMLFIDGVIQKQGTAYTISASTITMTTAPANGQDIYAMYVKR